MKVCIASLVGLGRGVVVEVEREGNQDEGQLGLSSTALAEGTWRLPRGKHLTIKLLGPNDALNKA